MPEKQPAAQPESEPNDCAICNGIPDYKFVETLHTDERLPEEVDQLEVIGGYGLYGCEQLRKCPICGTFYSFLHDHDSESGMGYGYTDESIKRLTTQQAIDMIERTMKTSKSGIEYWSKKGDPAGKRPDFLTMHQQELKRLKRELRTLHKLNL